MFYPDTFQMSLPGDREIRVTRTFGAPRPPVFDAFTKPDLVRRWLLGPPGWAMPVCEIDLKPGGRYRYVWSKPGVPNMGLGGTFREVSPPERLVATEKFDQAWYPGEALVTTTFLEGGDTTKVTISILYESMEARDTAGRSGMERGLTASYNRLEEFLAQRPATNSIIEPPQILSATERSAAVIHLTIPRSEMGAVMGPALAELMSVVKAQGAGPAGPWFTHHLKMDPAIFDFDICVPVAAPVTSAGRVEPKIFPTMTVARTVYCGAYERLGAAWSEFGAWIAANGHSAGPDLYECYAVGPESGKNPGDWRTELTRPLIA